MQGMINRWKRLFACKLDDLQGDFEWALHAIQEELYKQTDRMCFEYQVRVHNQSNKKLN